MTMQRLENLLEARQIRISKLNTQNQVQPWTMAAQVQEQGDISKQPDNGKDRTSPTEAKQSAVVNQISSNLKYIYA